MKLKDIKAGQIVTDKLGNEYKVLFVAADGDDMPVELECIKFSEEISVDGIFTFRRIGQCFWIYKSKKSCQKDGMCQENCISVKSLKLKSDVE